MIVPVLDNALQNRSAKIDCSGRPPCCSYDIFLSLLLTAEDLSLATRPKSGPYFVLSGEFWFFSNPTALKRI
jgi:hypothetical protein